MKTNTTIGTMAGRRSRTSGGRGIVTGFLGLGVNCSQKTSDIKKIKIKSLQYKI